MAFRRTDVDIPKDATFPEDLDKLGFRLNPALQVVDKQSGKFFEYLKYAEPTTNQQRYNTMHKAVRKQVYRALSYMGVTELYFYEDPDTNTQRAVREKPAYPSIRILSSPLDAPDQLKELYLVVGDSKADLGVFSRKAMLTEDGLLNGTVVGLVGKLREAAMSDDSDNEESVAVKIPESGLPGVVILNPGESFWSPQAKECMSAVTWNDREREHGLSSPYKVTDPYNKVHGHEDARLHIRHCLDSFLRFAVAPTTRVNIIAVGDASQHILDYLNSVYAKEEERIKFTNMKINIAMVSPTHNNDLVTDPALKQFLAKHGRIWESHSLPKGTLLADVAPTTQQPDNEGLDSGEGVDKLSVSLAQTSLGEPSICQKFSAGVEDTPDMIFPRVMEDVMQFLEEKSV